MLVRDVGIVVTGEEGDGNPGGPEEPQHVGTRPGGAPWVVAWAGVERVAVDDKGGRAIKERAQLAEGAHAAPALPEVNVRYDADQLRSHSIVAVRGPRPGEAALEHPAHHATEVELAPAIGRLEKGVRQAGLLDRDHL